MAMSKCASSKLEEMLQCAVCFEVLDEPGTFKCFHSFCAGCITGFRCETQGGRQVYSCPVCRSPTDKTQLKTTHLMRDLLELHQLFKQQQDVCSKCKTRKPGWRCLQCKSTCCDTCKADHDFYIKDHTVVSLDDVSTAFSIDQSVRCPHHSDKLLELQCVQCQELICYLCKAVNHEGHACKTIEQAVQDALPAVKRHKAAIEKHVKDKNEAINKIKEEITHVNTWYGKMENRIEQRKSEAIAEITDEYAVLVKQMNDLKKEDLSQYETAFDQIECSVKEEESILKWTDNILLTSQGASQLHELQSNLLETLDTKARTVTSITVKRSELPEFSLKTFPQPTTFIGHIKHGIQEEVKVGIETKCIPSPSSRETELKQAQTSTNLSKLKDTTVVELPKSVQPLMVKFKFKGSSTTVVSFSLLKLVLVWAN